MTTSASDPHASSTDPLPPEIVHIGDEDPADISFSAMIGFILRHIRILLLAPFFGGAAGIILGLLFFRSYTAESWFVPESSTEGGLGRFAALAASAGISLPSGGSGQSPDFYVALVRSPETMRKLAETKFTFEDDDGETVNATLVELSGIDRPTYHRTILGVIDQLQGQVTAKADPVTQMVQIKTTAPWMPLSEQMNRRILELITEFNDQRRTQIAAAERVFVEGRMAAMESEVRAAETAVRQFLERNRGYQNSPQLSLELDRLRRDLTLRQQVQSGLAQSLEAARIEEVRNTPQITIVTPPEGTGDRTRLLKYILVFAVLGGIIGVGGAFLREWTTRDAARRPADYAALRTLRPRDLYDEVVGRRRHGTGG